MNTDCVVYGIKIEEFPNTDYRRALVLGIEKQLMSLRNPIKQERFENTVKE
jgi:hypothetical protein